jgi:hypothetical protein
MIGLHLHSLASEAISQTGLMLDRLFDHPAMVPVVFSAMADITVLILLPLVGILTAIPSKKKSGLAGLQAVSYLFAAFVWFSSVVAVYDFVRGRLFAAIFLFFGAGLLFLLSVACLLRGVRSRSASRIGLAALFFLFIAPVLVSPFVYFQHRMWPDLVCLAVLLMLVFAFRGIDRHAFKGRARPVVP